MVKSRERRLGWEGTGWGGGGGGRELGAEGLSLAWLLVLWVSALRTISESVSALEVICVVC